MAPTKTKVESSMQRNFIQLACDSVLGYAFWSLVHGLGPMIWFYPLNELDITGYEAFVVVAFSPILFLLGKSFNKFLRSSTITYMLLLIMLGGCASFHAGTTLSRLVVLATGVGAAFLIQCSLWWSSDVESRKISFWGFTLGYLALLASRIWYVSFTPLWNDYATNKAIVTLMTIATGMRIMLNQSHSQTQDPAKELPKKEPFLLASLGYGALFFMLHAVFGEVSIVSRFTVQGFPDTGPTPNPWGGLILLMLTVGLFLSMHTNIASNMLWSVAGFASSMGLMFFNGWIAFVCGAFLAVYVMSVWPVICSKMVNCDNPGKCLLVANSIYLIGVFGMVWCTAYNFVPFGGELARERTYIIVGVMMVLVALSATRPTHGTLKLAMSLQMPDMKYYVNTPSTNQEKSEDADFGKIVKKIMFFIVMSGLIGFEYRKLAMPKYNELRDPDMKVTTGTKEFSALIWTFHFGYDNKGWPSMDRAAELLNNTGADVITLLESDASKPYLGNNDIAMWLGEKLGMYSDFGPSTRDHTWGNLLLSKYPIVKSKHHLLPSPEGELAPAISATVNVSGSLVDFVVTHMGNDGDDLDRRLQAEALSNLCSVAENPVVFLGYVTSRPGSRDYKNLINNGRMKDIDSTDRDRWCEYIMYRGLTKLGYARISHGGLSDTELQMARWKIESPSADVPIQDRFKVTTSNKDTPITSRFNSVFGDHYSGHWHGNGHHFHMSTPKYFIP